MLTRDAVWLEVMARAGLGRAILATLAARMTRWVAKRRQRQQNRQAYLHLLTLDDRQLRDVGMTRADVLAALSRPEVWDED
ncbi:MAG: DUF1127 domain-containing protein [Pseudomonadota bacterium]